jgi:hypothetical protein
MIKPLLIDYPIDEVIEAFQSSQDKRELPLSMYYSEDPKSLNVLVYSVHKKLHVAKWV